jgi:hypothetical protein
MNPLHEAAAISPAAGAPPTRTSGRRRARAALVAGLAVLVTMASLIVAGGGPATASTLNGTATLANPTTLAELTSGGSTTNFTVNLPANAACSGDTASHGYLVYSYLVPEGTNPSWVSFTAGPSRGLGLVSSTGAYYGPANTAIGTGQIVEIPNNLQFGPLVSVKHVPLNTLLYSNGNTSGVWEAGIACAHNGVLTDNWNTEITFTASGTDANGFVWSQSPGPCTTNNNVGFFSPDAATFTGGVSNTFFATSTGCPAPTISETGALPTGVTFNAQGVLTGTPSVGGVFHLTLSAKIGSQAPATQAFTLTVPLFVTTTSLPTLKRGVAYSKTLKASGGTAPYKWSTTTVLPKGLTLSTTGTLSGTVPTSVAKGTVPIKFKVKDSSAPTKEKATAILSLTIT